MRLLRRHVKPLALLTVTSFCSYLFNTELGVSWSVPKTFASSDFTSDIHSRGKETYLHTLLDSIDYSSILLLLLVLLLLLHLCSAISPGWQDLSLSYTCPKNTDRTCY